jgi:hypothetical protein
MTVLCSWCSKQVSRWVGGSRPTEAEAAVSHGICPSCLKEQIARLGNATQRAA